MASILLDPSLQSARHEGPSLSSARREARAIGWLVLPDGRETPIDEGMIALALCRIEAARLSLHGSPWEACGDG